MRSIIFIDADIELGIIGEAQDLKRLLTKLCKLLLQLLFYQLVLGGVRILVAFDTCVFVLAIWLDAELLLRQKNVTSFAVLEHNTCDFASIDELLDQNRNLIVAL